MFSNKGQKRNFVTSVEEYERLKRRNQEAFMAADAPDELVADLKSYLRGKKQSPRANSKLFRI
ncbi:MAG TPA: hypothetical protein VGT78_04460 [Rhizomicrobium sp.]|nr:hypothetical protein [Rhizomicrobium sp.]